MVQQENPAKANPGSDRFFAVRTVKWDLPNSPTGEVKKASQAASNAKETLIPDVKPQKPINPSPRDSA